MAFVSSFSPPSSHLLRGSRATGFSLVELSIVLVILGLLTGGILAGQSLIRAAELRSITTDYQRYTTATQTFRDKYQAIPGDMRNATRFWGDNNTACADAAIANGTPGTCNGNGDGIIANPTLAASATDEIPQLFNQLALAGLIEGSYTGTWNASASYTIGTTVPRLKMNNSMLFSGSGFNWPGDGDTYRLEYGNYLYYSGNGGGAILRPEEAWNIDTKLDDGKPASGFIIARWYNDLCAAADNGTHTNTNLAASYKLTETAIRCSLYFIKQF
jgi:prepilin-type N-terminal cleavage/methylation domain-containing protein